MIRIRLSLVFFIGFIVILISCKNSTSSYTDNDKQAVENDKKHSEKKGVSSVITVDSNLGIQTQVDLKASEFVRSLENKQNLSSFFSNHWVLAFHEDNRCDGSTDGVADNLRSTQVDSIIKIQVKNDGNGWACDKKEPKRYDYDFDLKKHVARWDRFEISIHDNIIYVVGAGESDYIKLHFNDNNLIINLEYRSEDPG